MEKTITIDGKDYRMVANGATPRIYRGMFQKEIFTAMANAITQKGEILDSEVFENLAYCMAVQGGSLETSKKIDSWLAEMSSPLAIILASSEIMELWTEETKQTSSEKKG